MTTHGGGPQQGAPGGLTKRVETPLDVWVVAADGSFEGSTPSPSIAAAVASIVERVSRTQTQETADVDLLSESGVSRTIRVTARPIACGAVVVAVLGLDALHEAEESLSRYDLIMRATHDAVWDWNLVTEKVWWNQQLYDMLGYEPLTTVPSLEAWLRRIHPEDRERVVQNFDAAVASGASVWHDEFRFLRGEADAGVGVVFDRGYIERDADGRALRMIGVMSDVTEQRSTTAALQASEELFRQLTSAIEEVFWLVNRDSSEVVYVSPAYETIWGRPVESVYRNPSSFLDAIHEDDRARIQALIPVHDHSVYNEVYRIRRPDGKIAWIRDRGFPIRNAAGEVIRIAGVATDITAQRQLEQQLAEAQRMESVGRLAGGIAHDFNNLLTVILSGVQLAAQGALDNSARADLASIADAAERAARLTAQLLAFASRQVIAPARLDLNELTRQTENLLRRVIGEHIEFTIVLDPELHSVMADRAQLEQVLVNLAINARDAMPSGGRLTIQTRNHAVAREPAAAHPHLKPGDYVMLSVSDSGVGIARDDLPHIFEPFFTTKPAGQGTGLGLATCYGVVHQAGGELLVHTESGLGTTFEVVLPRAVADLATTAGRVSDVNLSRGTETVLFVEDDPAVRRIGMRILTEQGYHMLSASSGAEAVRVASEHSGPIHLLLTDVVMPQLSGPELARRLVEKRPEMRVLYTSGYAADTVAQEDTRASRAAFLQKPYVLDTLLAKVREVLSASSPAAASRNGPS